MLSKAKKEDIFILPLKAAVRKKCNLDEGSEAEFKITIKFALG